MQVELIDRLTAAGCGTIEAASFVSPKWVPQMADGGEVLAKIRRKQGVKYAALTPNLRGLEQALGAGVDEVQFAAVRALTSYSEKGVVKRWWKLPFTQGRHGSFVVMKARLTKIPTIAGASGTELYVYHCVGTLTSVCNPQPLVHTFGTPRWQSSLRHQRRSARPTSTAPSRRAWTASSRCWREPRQRLCPCGVTFPACSAAHTRGECVQGLLSRSVVEVHYLGSLRFT